MDESPRLQLEQLLQQLRERAISRGMQDPAWDLAFDIEGCLRGLETLSPFTAEQLGAKAKALLEQQA